MMPPFSDHNPQQQFARQPFKWFRLAAFISLLLTAGLTVFFLSHCGKSKDAARRELQRRSVPVTEEELISRVKNRDAAMVTLLLSAGVNPNARNKDGSTALMEAMVAGSSEISSALLSAGADINARADNGSTALHSAALISYVEGVELLLRKGADVNAANKEGETPLMIAALKGSVENAKLMLATRANLDVKDNRGETPLMHAVERNHTEVAQLLRNAGAKE